MEYTSSFNEKLIDDQYGGYEEVGGNTASKDESGDMTFCMSSYAKEAMQMMFMMRSHHMLTDVVLEVNRELFHAHKVVLSAASPYFKAMFTGGLKECEMKCVTLQGVCPTAMGRIIYFMYTGHIRVTEVTVCQLLPAATMLQVPNVIDACCGFLERQLDPSNAIGISNFAEQHGCTSLKQKANQFIERHFTQICQEEEFLQLSGIQLIQLIRKDELNVQQEREVYDAVLKWVKYDEESRHGKMQHILYAVRCQFLTPSFLKDQMKNCDVLKRVPACREYLARIFKDLTLHKRSAVKERTPNTTRMIFISGGYLQHSLDILEGFNVDDKTWVSLPRLRVPRSGLGAAFLKGNFYAVGGRNNSPGSSYDSDWVDRYNPILEQWRPCAPMSVPRHRVGVAVMDERLYAVGGSAGSEYHNSVEYYDPDEDRWVLVPPMHSARLGVGVAVVDRLLYAIGGFDGVNRLSTGECYHPENNEWSVIPAMLTSRSGAGCASIDNYIFMVGGFDGTRQLSSVERYDTEKRVWETVAPVRIGRSALSLTVLDGKLFAMGGYDGHTFLTIVEVYDPKTNIWEEGTHLTSGRSGHASAVIYQPSYAAQYTECLIPERDAGGSQGRENADQDDGNPKSTCTSNTAGAQTTDCHVSYTSFAGGRCTKCNTTPEQTQRIAPKCDCKSDDVYMHLVDSELLFTHKDNCTAGASSVETSSACDSSNDVDSILNDCSLRYRDDQSAMSPSIVCRKRKEEDVYMDSESDHSGSSHQMHNPFTFDDKIFVKDVFDNPKKCRKKSCKITESKVGQSLIKLSNSLRNNFDNFFNCPPTPPQSSITSNEEPLTPTPPPPTLQQQDPAVAGSSRGVVVVPTAIPAAKAVKQCRSFLKCRKGPKNPAPEKKSPDDKS